MCWNYEVSLTFSVLYLIINSYYLIAKPKYWREYFLFGMFYFTMELFQTMQWIFGGVEKNNLYGVDQCNSMNTNYTIVAHILIWLQPILFSYIGYRTNENKTFFYRYTIMNIVIFLFSLVLLDTSGINKNNYIIENSIYGLSTCTNEGRTGHLVWRFKPKIIEYFPNYLMYITSCVLSFIMYEKSKIRVIGTGWLLSFIVTYIILRPSLIEMASSWCLLSIVANAYILIRTYQ